VPRPYRLGRRQPSVDATGRSILVAAAELLRESGDLSLTAVARKAGVARITVYDRFGSRAALLAALSPPSTAATADARSGRDALRRHFELTCRRWAADPALFRNLRAGESTDEARHLAEWLAAEDALRPGCSIREAEDVIATLSSFPVFDRLHRDGRRSDSAVAEVLMRLAGGVVA
jgi:AcrR family transcriptional regulator